MDQTGNIFLPCFCCHSHLRPEGKIAHLRHASQGQPVSPAWASNAMHNGGFNGGFTMVQYP